MSKKNNNLVIAVRPSAERHHTKNTWLDSYYSFSFAEYWEAKYAGFGALHILNEDRIKAKNGFPMHQHQDFEIYSYIVSGELTHKDNLQQEEHVMRRGDVQFTTAGTGIMHSEMNQHKSKAVHLLQIWHSVKQTGIAPSYQTMHFSDADKSDKLCLLISEKGPIVAHQDLYTYASMLNANASLQYRIKAGRRVHIHVVQLPNAKLQVNDVELLPGDGAFIKKQAGFLNITALNKTEFLLFDVPDVDQ